LQQKMELKRPVSILHLEDNPLDIELVSELLKDAGLDCVIERVRTRYAFQECLHWQEWDVILADFGLPAFDGLTALALARELQPRTPFIFVTGTMGEENAVESLKHGATDYVMKQNLARLAPAVERALKDRAEKLRRLETEAKLHEAQKQLQYLAYHDAVTGLPNRTYLSERLPDMLADARRDGTGVAVLFIDLDKFKSINDSLGHAVGDLVLKSVADRLKAAIRQGDMAARVGGDEFVLVLRSMKDRSDPAMTADRIIHAIAADITTGQHQLIVTCSIGISLSPENGTDAESLIRNADAALYAAKEKGRNTWRFFTSELNQRGMERLAMEHALRHALDGEEFFIEYQPQVEIATGKLVGVEALLRWGNAELGLVPPASFIPVAERTGEMQRIGEWVLRKACRQAKAWEGSGNVPPVLAVNVSALQFTHPSFQETLCSALSDAGLEPERLELELTETQLMENAETLGPLLHRLRKMGIKLAIDDFGVGYCGLHYLRTFPFSKLKIDQSFVRSILVAPRDAALTRAVIDMARGLQLELVAECVETMEQVRLLQSLGCEQIQGYIFSHPVPGEAFEERFLRGEVPAALLPKASQAASQLHPMLS